MASNEFVKYATIDNSAADMLSKLLIDDLRKKHDPVFTGANAAIAGQQPAGIAYNAVPIASTGATAAATITDTRSMIAAQVDGVGSARDGLFISSTEAYSFLAMLKVLDADGRTLGGLPIISGAPSGTFLLLDASSLSYAVDDAARVRVSTSGTVEMSDAPTGNTITPTAATNSIISLFQDECTAFLASISSDWALDDAHADSSGNPACIQLTGATWT